MDASIPLGLQGMWHSTQRFSDESAVCSLRVLGAQVSLDAEDIRNEKVKVLRSMKMISMDDVVLGQYRGRKTSTAKLPGYLDDETVPAGRSAHFLHNRKHILGCYQNSSALLHCPKMRA